jgi:transcriptional regulator with XRE-family HTH domain
VPKVKTNFKTRKPIYVRQWRKFRNLTLDQLSARLEITSGALSQLERGEVNYTRATLEALADALRCEPGDLLIRNPLDPESPWTIWDKLKPATRRQALAILRTLADEDAQAA